MLRSSTCVDVVNQLPGGRFDFDSWKIGCDNYFKMSQLQGTKQRRKKVQNTQSKMHRFNRYLLDKIDGEVLTNKFLKHNLLYSLTNDNPLDEQVQTTCPTTRTKNAALTRTDSFLPSMQSPSPPPMLETNDSSFIPPMIPSPPMIHAPPTNPSSSTTPPSSSIPPPRPTVFAKVKREKHEKMKEKSRKWDKLIDFGNRECYSLVNESARRLVGIAMAFAPMTSLIPAKRFICLIHGSLFRELEMSTTPEEVVNVAPSQTSTRNTMTGTVADCLAATRAKNKGKLLFLSIDAANEDRVY